ncbi:ATP-binding protein [Williamsia soli]|uniref:ATP-binding protein n=1 Tax=Williamsia soli TaxID=364929 RepID=UPI001A9EE98A|nr:AAA family ATPase [Williamsia soli]
MKLHRLRLSHFRGVAEREVHFAENGVTVVEGANEAGKSSMIEALDLLLEVRSDSKSAKVRAVSPAGVDAGTVVEADITCGPYRFTYTKQYNKAARTELVIHEPAPQQFSGRTAHDKVGSILADEVDATLFKALRLMQAGDPTVGDLAASSALSRALDAAAGTTKSGVGDGEGDAMLLELVRAEYERYFTTGQGRPARELASAAIRLEEALELSNELAAAMDQLGGDHARLETLTGNRRELANSLELAKVELSALSERSAESSDLQRQHTAATSTAALLRGQLRLHDRDVAQRAASRKRIADCDKAVDVTGRAIATLERKDAEVAAVLADVERELDELRRADSEATSLVRSARAAARSANLLARRDELTALLARVADIRTALSDEQRTVAGLVHDRDDLEAVEQLLQSVTITRAQVESAAATVSVRRLGDAPVTVNGAESDESEWPITGDTVVEVAGVVRLVLSAGAESASLIERFSRAERELADALTEAGVDDVAELRGLVRARERAEAEVDNLRGRLTAIIAGGDEGALRAELSELESRLESTAAADPDVPDVEEAERRAGTAAARLAAAVQRTAELRSEHRSVDSELRILRVRRDELIAERVELARQDDEIGGLDAADHPDDDPDRLRERLLAELSQADSEVRRLVARIDDADLESLELQHANMLSVVERGEPRLAELGNQIAELRTRIEIRRDDGKLDQVHQAETELAAARGDFDRINTRAQAARLLLQTLERHRDATRRTYVQPFTDQILRLGKVVFGPTLQVGVDEELRVTTRTVGGVTVDHDALSGGAKEQLGIISRLACAMLVDPDDGVPVIIDDALGYTDPERLASMGAVLSHAGRHTQVIVLTCTPARYSSVGGAHLIAV